MAYVQWKMFALIIIVSFVRVGLGACIYDDSSPGECSDPALQPVVNTQAETYGPGSRCVETAGTWVRMEGGTLTSSDPSLRNGCYQYSCSRDNGVTIMVLGNSFHCSRKDEVLDIDITVSGVRYQGSLICPSCAEICYDELFNCPDVLSVELNFDRSVYRVSEEVDSKNLALYVCLTANSTDRPFAATLTPLSGTALAGEDFIAVSEEIEFEVGNMVRSCGCIGIIEDSSVEALETFEVNVAVPDKLVEVSGQTVATVELVDSDGEEDSRLYFTDGSPRVDGNTVSADFVVGNSFTSVLCRITTRTTPVDCSRGTIEYSDLNPDSTEAYQLEVIGTLPDGSTKELVRSVHLDTILDCWVHFINNGTTVNGETVTFEFEGTGPPALLDIDLPFICKIDGINQFTDCTSPHSVTSPALLEDGEYSFIIRYDPNRVECKQKQTTYISFEIIRKE